MDFSRSSFTCPTFLWRRHRFWPLLAGTVLLGALHFAGSAQAQNGRGTAQKTAPPTLAAPLTAPAVVPTAPNLKILILAIDELPAPARITPNSNVPVVPDAIVPDAILPILPAEEPAFSPASATFIRPSWIAQAQKKKKAEKVDKDADLFRLEPATGGATLAKKGAMGIASIAPDPNPAPGAMLPSPTVPFTGEVMGRSRLAALPLRNSLLALGWRDVTAASPTSALFTNALNDRRLTSRTLDTLQAALKQLATPGAVPLNSTTKRAILAATRIGQSLGYRAVAVLYVSPSSLQNGVQNAGFSVLLADSAREAGEPILFDEKGTGETELRQAGASTAAVLMDRTLRLWPDVSDQSRLDLAATHLTQARAFLAAGDALNAQDELNQAVALDSSKAEPFVLLGDLLATTDPSGAARAYRSAVELDARDGATLAKVAVAYTGGTIPDWPRALDAGRKAIALGFDSVPMRVAMATAQFGRADLFRKADREDRAEDAEIDAREHLKRALELAPDDPLAVRLMARQLVESGRFTEATQTLDQIAPRYPKDLEIQTQYALALSGQTGREEDAFVAYGRVWKLSGTKSVLVDDIKYRALSRGFDLRLYNLGKSAVQLTTGVANATLPREDALIQLTRLKENLDEAENAIDILRAPTSVAPDAPAARQYAAGLMSQSLEQQQYFLETGVTLARTRAFQLYSQSVAQLNAARGRG